ncbi:MAG TPA: hypothetical protein VMP08_02160, partial [Anaerolineae bacterium]|nr:hypothetical protein [Anaerolineae bacterium]
MRTRLFSSFLIAIILLASCTAPVPAPTPTSTVLPAATATTGPIVEPTATVAPSVTPQTRSTPSRPAATYPPRPTATPFSASEESEQGVYVNGDSGLTVHYPDRWLAMPPDQGSDILQYFFSPGGDVAAGVLVNPTGEDTLKSFGPKIRDAILNGLQGIKIVSDKADQMADGRDAWTSVATAKRSDGSALKVRITTAFNGGRAYTIFVFGAPSDFDQSQDDITALATSLTLERPRLYGIPRDQALVLAG